MKKVLIILDGISNEIRVIDAETGESVEHSVQVINRLDTSPLFDTSVPVDHEKMSKLVDTMHPKPRLEIL